MAKFLYDTTGLSGKNQTTHLVVGKLLGGTKVVKTSVNVNDNGADATDVTINPVNQVYSVLSVIPSFTSVISGGAVKTVSVQATSVSGYAVNTVWITPTAAYSGLVVDITTVGK
jgi:hypothetical protein